MRRRHTGVHSLNAAMSILLVWLWSPLAADPLDSHLSEADARHLLSRTGLGVNYRDMRYLTGKSRKEAIAFVVDGFSITPALPMPTWADMPAPLYWTRQDLAADDRRVFDRRRDAEFVELQQWWIDTMITTESPQTERMVLFWHDHFATSYYGINRQSKALAQQNQTFRQNALGNFRTLLKAMIRDAALLNYLDNLSNKKNSPNENLARELLELFTMGEGRYDQHTVAEAARALTGYGISQNRDLSFEFRSWDFDVDTKELFGVNGKHNADDLIDLILQQPAVPFFLAGKFWHAFVSDQPPTDKQLAPIANAFRQSDYDLSVLYRTLLESESFWHAETRASLIKSPAQLIIGAARTLHFPTSLNNLIPALLTRSGMTLFAPPNVAGWPEGPAWISSGRLLNRQAAMEELLWHDSTSTGTGSPAMGNGMMMMSNAQDPDSPLQLHMAAENYRGAARYKVALLAKNNHVIWELPETELINGHETTKFGRIREVGELPWQVVDINPPGDALEMAELVRIYFLNDDGGNDGDRNLYIRGASMRDTWIDSSQGQQKSKCNPKSSYNAGRLYCNGYVDLAIQHEPKGARALKPPYASSVHVNWIRARKNQLDLTLTLQDFHTAKGYYPTFSFHLKSRKNQAPALELNTYGCLPDCLQEWPDCAWTDSLHEARKTVAFLVDGPGMDESLRCHLAATSDSERQIVSSLFKSAANLTTIASSSARDINQRRRAALERWQKVFAMHEPAIHTHHGNAADIIIDASIKTESPAPQRPHRFYPELTSLLALERELTVQNVTLAELLLPGIPSDALPELNELESLDFDKQLRKLTSHPVFQLH